MSTTHALLFLLMFLAAIWAFTSFFRAASFARRNEDRLPSLMEKSSWWLLLFKKNTFGPEVEAERKRLSFNLAASFITMFAIIGAFRLFGM